MQKIAIIAVVAMFGKLIFISTKNLILKKCFELFFHRLSPIRDPIAISSGMLSISAVQKL
jgi:hypothetical protein